MHIQSPGQKLSVTVEVLSPVHVGDGGVLKRDLDFIVHKGRTYVIHVDRFTRWAYEDQPDDRWMRATPGQVLQNYDPMQIDVFSYQMRGAPERDEIRTFEKNGFGKAYLPGSSLKGMLRTIYIWGLYAARDQKPDLNRVGKSRSFAGLPVERQVMGADANRDLFRAIHISDSEPIPNEQLRVIAVDIYPTAQQRGHGVVTACEAATEGTVFQNSLILDTYGFRDQPANELGWRGKANWLSRETILQVARAFSEQRLRQELDYYGGRESAKLVYSFYRDVLVKRFQELQDDQFLAQLGWGTGWNSKTLNELLLADKQRFARIIQDYRLKRNATGFAPGDTFPKSRHLLRSQGQSVRPMGWVLVTIG